jgi:hypothetical protein
MVNVQGLLQKLNEKSVYVNLNLFRSEKMTAQDTYDPRGRGFESLRVRHIYE